jgi:hypothetical protein
MEIIEITTQLKKWEQNCDDFSYPLKEGEKQGFELFPRRDIYKSICNIYGIIHITCLETDLILDIEYLTIVEFDTSGKPTVENIYDLYKNARARWLAFTLQESVQRGYRLMLQAPHTPLELIRPLIERAILKAYPDDN